MRQFFRRKVSALPILATLIMLCTTLSSCGEVPNSFVYTTEEKLQYLSWEKNGNDGAIAGTAIFLSLNENTYINTDKEVNAQQVGFTGTQKDNVITIQFGALYTQTGKIDNQQMAMNAIGGSGESASQMWYATPKDQYNQLAVAFQAHAKLRKQVNAALEHIKDDKFLEDSSTYRSDSKVERARSAVKFKKQNLEYAKTDPNIFFTCASLARIPEGTFQLESDEWPTYQTLDADKRKITSQWVETRKVQVPDVSFALPWRFDQKRVDQVTNTIDARKKEISNKVYANKKELDDLRKQADLLEPERLKLRKEYKCGG